MCITRFAHYYSDRLAETFQDHDPKKCSYYSYSVKSIKWVSGDFSGYFKIMGSASKQLSFYLKLPLAKENKLIKRLRIAL